MVQQRQQANSDIKTLTYITLANVNAATNEITITGHGFTTGQLVTYHADSMSKAIDGLTDGNQYYVIVIDANTIRLVSTKPIDISNSGVRSGSTHTLTPLGTLTFSPTTTSVNVDTNTFYISGHGFTNGQNGLLFQYG